MANSAKIHYFYVISLKIKLSCMISPCDISVLFSFIVSLYLFSIYNIPSCIFSPYDFLAQNSMCAIFLCIIFVNDQHSSPTWFLSLFFLDVSPPRFFCLVSPHLISMYNTYSFMIPYVIFLYYLYISVLFV